MQQQIYAGFQITVLNDIMEFATNTFLSFVIKVLLLFFLK